MDAETKTDIQTTPEVCDDKCCGKCCGDCDKKCCDDCDKKCEGCCGDHGCCEEKECGDACCGGHCGDHCCGGSDDMPDLEDDEEMPDYADNFEKTIEVEGTGYEKPTDDTTVKVDYEMKVGDKVVESKTDFEFVIGDVPVICDGFEKGVESMKLNEVCSFDLAPEEAFGAAGCPERGISPNETVSFKVTLKEMKSVPTEYTIAPENIVAFAEQKKNQGNALVKKNLHVRAIRVYKRGLDYLENEFRIPEDQKENAKKVKVLLHGNIAAMYVHEKDWGKVVEYCEKVLKDDDKNWKAYLRRGKAFLERNETEKAEEDFTKVVELDAENKEAKALLAKIAHVRKMEEKKDKQRYAKMFKALGTFDEIDQKREKEEKEYKEKAKKEWDEEKAKLEKKEAEKKEAEKDAPKEDAPEQPAEEQKDEAQHE